MQDVQHHFVQLIGVLPALHGFDRGLMACQHAVADLHVRPVIVPADHVVANHVVPEVLAPLVLVDMDVLEIGLVDLPVYRTLNTRPRAPDFNDELYISPLT